MQNEPQLSAELLERLEKIPLLNTSLVNNAFDSLKFVASEELKHFLATTLEEQRAYFIQEIKHVCRVHNYLPKEYENKIVRFISNLDKPQPEMSLTQKKEDTTL